MVSLLAYMYNNRRQYPIETRMIGTIETIIIISKSRLY